MNPAAPPTTTDTMTIAPAGCLPPKAHSPRRPPTDAPLLSTHPGSDSHPPSVGLPPPPAARRSSDEDSRGTESPSSPQRAENPSTESQKSPNSQPEDASRRDASTSSDAPNTWALHQNVLKHLTTIALVMAGGIITLLQSVSWRSSPRSCCPSFPRFCRSFLRSAPTVGEEGGRRRLKRATIRVLGGDGCAWSLWGQNWSDDVLFPLGGWDPSNSGVTRQELREGVPCQIRGFVVPSALLLGGRLDPLHPNPFFEACTS
jgi:hypothetical protein